MEKGNKPIKKFKKRKVRKFKCKLCEKIIMKPSYIKTRKNYPFGKKSKPIISNIHKQDGGVLIELKRKKKDG